MNTCNIGKTCYAEACSRPATRKGLCNMRDIRLRKYGRLHRLETRLKPLEDRFWQKVARRSSEDCWLWKGTLDSKGYGIIRIEANSRKRMFAHRLSYQISTGKSLNTDYVCHVCDNPPCVNPAHLFLGDAASNMKDKTAKLRQTHSEAVHTAQLTDQMAWAIRVFYARGTHTERQLADIYGVTTRLIRRLLRGDHWQNARFTPNSKAVQQDTPNLSDAMLGRGLAVRYDGRRRR